MTSSVHPEALEYPLMEDDELASLAEDIAANGQRDPIIRDRDGRVIDGRNRLEACRRAEVEPLFEDRDFADDDEISDFILSVNVEKRSLSSGQKAMFRACNLARNGKRRNGRWARGAINEDSRLSSSAWRKQMEQAGLVLDVAARAAALGDDYVEFASLPIEVKQRRMTLDAAHKIAQNFETQAAMREMAMFLPLDKSVGELEQLSIDADDIASDLPVVDAPLGKQRRNQLDETAKRLNAAATIVRNYLKENK